MFDDLTSENQNHAGGDSSLARTQSVNFLTLQMRHAAHSLKRVLDDIGAESLALIREPLDLMRLVNFWLGTDVFDGDDTPNDRRRFCAVAPEL